MCVVLKYVVINTIGSFTFIYTALCPVILREYLPVKWAGPFGAMFYLGISLGTNIAFLYQQSWMAEYYFLILWIPGAFALLMLLLYLIFFCVESPRVIFTDLAKKHSFVQRSEITNQNSDPELQQNEDNDLQTSEYTNVSDKPETLETDLLTQENEADKFYNVFINDSRMISFARKFYNEKDVPQFLRSVFDELDKAINESENKATKGIESKLGPFKLALHQKYRKQFMLVMLLNFLNQATGINCLVMYSTDIFIAIGYVDFAKIISVILGKTYKSEFYNSPI